MSNEKNIKKQRKKRKHRGAIRFLKFQIFLLILVLAGITYYYVGGYAGKINKLHSEANELVATSTEDTFKTAQTSIAYDDNNKVMSVLKGEKDVYYLPFDEIPVEARQAIVSIEDKKFYEHHGVDYKAIVRAAWAAVRNRRVTQGGSTITQQLAKNIFLTPDRKWERKVEEIYIAMDLEKKYGKKKILEFYLNNVYFGNGYYGIQAAAQGYFGKDVVNLSTSQTAFLCGIPNAPTRYNPRTHLDNALKRRDRVLRNMREDGILSQSDLDAAIAEKITIKEPKEYYNNYQDTFLYYCATRALMEADGFEFRYTFDNPADEKAYQAQYKQAYDEYHARLYTGGYRIYSTLNKDKQKKLQKSINEGLSSFKEKSKDGTYQLQGAGVCIDNETGSVVAIVGGRGQKSSVYTLNRAFQSTRQPGSTIKPLVVYTPALENGYTPNTVVDDHKFEGGPSNAGGTYSGKISMRVAVEKSKNTVAWQIFDKLTPKVGIDYLRNMKFASIEKTDETLAASLGGLTKGVSPLEMAKGYATIENDGAYRDPTCIAKITTADGGIVWENDHEESIVYQEEAARQMTDILQGVITRGTGVGLGLGDMPCAGKTGTTNGSKDGWFVGYTPYYTTSIWVGYDIPRTLNGLAGATYPGHIWQNYMKQIHQGLAVKKFEKPIKVYGKKEKDISEDEAKKAEKELKDKKNQDKVNIDLNRDDPDQNTNKDDQNNNNNNTNTETNNNGDNTNNNNSGDENNGDNADNNTDLPDLPPEDERDDVE
ncbi:penicillin-binding protein, 1A family [Lachnospiraceae bacterium KHCPX20]|nr:penicillin-binding protein, 1A family [Lachnospiraceae bacterium KHCPX20]